MLVDANLLLCARDEASLSHETARNWLTGALNGTRRVGIPWSSAVAFLRISTHPRAYEQPLAPSEAWRQVEDWLSAPAAWVPAPTEQHASVLGDLLTRHEPRGNLVSDAHLAALAIEHGLDLFSADTDFARFGELRWVNPLVAD